MSKQTNSLYQEALQAIKSHNEFTGHNGNILGFLHSLFINVFPEAPFDAPMHIRNIIKGLTILLSDPGIYSRLIEDKAVPPAYSQTFLISNLWTVLEFFEVMNGDMALDELLEYSLEKSPQQYDNDELLTAFKESYIAKLRVRQFGSAIRNLKAV